MQKIEQQASSQELFRIIHFNDVYDIQQGDKDPIGGVARFKTAIDNLRNDKTLVLFSGDAFSPSILSDIYRGQQMILPLNSFNIDVACLGNHDLDFAQQEALKLQQQTNFPWVLSNFFYKGTTNRLLQCKEFVILQKFGFKFGIFGLAEKQWVDTLHQYYHDKLDYVDYNEYAELMVHTLREDHGCNFIIALTHMMGYNDTKLAKSVQGIDLILGGHDHTIRSEQIKNIPVIKSGTNFKQLSVIRLNKSKQRSHFHCQHYGVDIQLVKITDNIKEDPLLREHVYKYMKDIEEERNQTGLILDADINLRFQNIRKNESPYLRLLTQWYLAYLPCDIAMFNSGNQRNDAIYHSGPLQKKNIFNNCKDQCVAKKIKGAKVLQVLENGVCMYPSLSGRYSAFAGVEFTWDSSKPAGHRVVVETVKVKGMEFDLNHQYVVATHHFQSVGGDGYVGLREADWVFKPEQPVSNVDIVGKFLNAESLEAQEFARLNPEYYNIKENYHGVKQIHFNPNKIQSNIKMI